jgi:hypothetical protein
MMALEKIQHPSGCSYLVIPALAVSLVFHSQCDPCILNGAEFLTYHLTRSTWGSCLPRLLPEAQNVQMLVPKDLLRKQGTGDHGR